ncbi:hypothetical protein GJ744_004725 [Endocarpon pusillum]|uniref:Uncharacterized protein n=1 Tax=Endocarpon pusillum TaxID=364733 RepID=A0A8H7A6H2_9EURO|nr:hypothetical protein GJ744_004725 [Endocarpon pusillum]
MDPDPYYEMGRYHQQEQSPLTRRQHCARSIDAVACFAATTTTNKSAKFGKTSG